MGGRGGRKATTGRKARYVSEDDLDSPSSDAEFVDPLRIHPIEEAQMNHPTINNPYPINYCHDAIKLHIVMRTNWNLRNSYLWLITISLSPSTWISTTLSSLLLRRSIPYFIKGGLTGSSVMIWMTLILNLVLKHL